MSQFLFRLLEALIQSLGQSRNACQSFVRFPMGKKTLQERLFIEARNWLGKDASPLDIASDELGCAESISNIISKVTDFPIITGTWTLWDKMDKDPRFKRVAENNGRGTIVISPTGTGNHKIRGHAGILGEGVDIMSATSRDGIFRTNYTIGSWKERYKGIGMFPIYYYKLVSLEDDSNLSS